MTDPQAIIQTAALMRALDMSLSTAERQTLRSLAGRAAELAARPVEAEKRELWTRHNRLEATRPVIFCDPENSWNEILPPESLACSSALGRNCEFQLRRQIFWGEQMNDDTTLASTFDIPHVHQAPDWGLSQQQIGGEHGGAYRWNAPIQSEADLERLHAPVLRIDFDATQRLAALADEIFGDLLPVRIKTGWFWTVGLTQTLVYLRGLEQMLFDLAENPTLMHRLMGILSRGTLALLEALEEGGLLYLNNDGAYIGSGALGWTDELPQKDFTGMVRLQDLWGLAESQETVGVSPRMFGEFIFPYQLPLMQRFGLICYGCCEPADNRWKYLSTLPNLRRVSVSPWSDRAKMAGLLGNRYIFSLKPNPAHLAMETFDEELVRSALRTDLEAGRGCRVEVVMKDNHTIRNDPRRVIRWVQIAKEEAERIGA
jgi:hypothetical protein